MTVTPSSPAAYHIQFARDVSHREMVRELVSKASTPLRPGKLNSVTVDGDSVTVWSI